MLLGFGGQAKGRTRFLVLGWGWREGKGEDDEFWGARKI